MTLLSCLLVPGFHIFSCPKTEWSMVRLLSRSFIYFSGIGISSQKCKHGSSVCSVSSGHQKHQAASGMTLVGLQWRWPSERNHGTDILNKKKIFWTSSPDPQESKWSISPRQTLRLLLRGNGMDTLFSKAALESFRQRKLSSPVGKLSAQNGRCESQTWALVVGGRTLSPKWNNAHCGSLFLLFWI